MQTITLPRYLQLYLHSRPMLRATVHVVAYFVAGFGIVWTLGKLAAWLGLYPIAAIVFQIISAITAFPLVDYMVKRFL